MITKFRIDVSMKGKQKISVLRKRLTEACPGWNDLTMWKVVKQGNRNPKEKGNQGERDIAKQLSLWWSEGKSPEIFTRQESSGAKIHTAKDSKRWVGGDIKAIGIKGTDFTRLISVEVKNVKDMELYKATYGEGVFWKFWQQALDDAKRASKQPWLIFKQNNEKWMIAVQRQLFYFLENYFGSYKHNFCMIHNDEKMCAVCVLEEFLYWTGDGVQDMLEACYLLLEGM